MSSPDLSEKVVAVLAAVQRVIARMGHRGVIIGGVAANLLGSPRFTADVDAVVLASIEDLEALLAAHRARLC